MCRGGWVTTHTPTHTPSADRLDSMASSLFKCCQNNWKSPSEDRKSNFCCFLKKLWSTNFASFKVALTAVGRTLLFSHLWRNRQSQMCKCVLKCSKSCAARWLQMAPERICSTAPSWEKGSSFWPDFRWKTLQMGLLSLRKSALLFTLSSSAFVFSWHSSMCFNSSITVVLKSRLKTPIRANCL